MIPKIKHYLSLVKFSHTIFAMPFAFIGFFMGVRSTPDVNLFIKLLLIVFTMVLARNAAMGFNRLIDRHIDSKNPRTKNRELPVEIVKPQSVLFFILINSVLFICSTFFINKLSFILSPLALLIILGYSYTKRFTFLSHLVLGLSLSIAPIGAYIAVTNSIHFYPMILSASVLFWVGGFDILYALQDEEFDRKNKLLSIPVKWGGQKSKHISAIFHFISILLIVLLGTMLSVTYLYWIGVTIFILFLIYQHYLVYKYGLKKIDRAFFTSNGFASLFFALFVCIDLFFFR
ncbi:MAG: putative 4-hydroxybenzoate polyprenyltransferase [Bacteroidales bacterium]|nr:putative 4-hydroxybenzoate polyprenyltransferase [Bacteroidales bacterium]